MTTILATANPASITGDRSDAIGRAILKIEAAVAARYLAETRAALDDALIARMVMPSNRWRITANIYGYQADRAYHNSLVWPPRPGMTAADVLADCRTMIAAQEESRRTQHYAFDRGRWLALRQAEAALIKMGAE